MATPGKQLSCVNCLPMQQNWRHCKKYRTLDFTIVGGGHPEPLQKVPPGMGYRAEFERCWSNSTSVLRTRIRRKTGSLASRLSMSLKVTGIDTERSATYDFLVPQ